MAFMLVIQRKGRSPQVFRLLQPSVIIGRGKGTDLLLPDISVSRHHARVDRSGDDGYTVVDLESQNGTLVNGKAVSSVALHHGDTLQIGKFLLSFEEKVARPVDDPEGEMKVYSTADERTGFMRKVSAEDGEDAHATTILDCVQLQNAEVGAMPQAEATVISVDSGEAIALGDEGLRFGKGGLAIKGGGLGGAATLMWTGQAHELGRESGMFFGLTVNGSKVATAQTLSTGDTFTVGKSEFQYR